MKTPDFKTLIAISAGFILAVLGSAQTTVFNDTFAAGSTVNSNPAMPATPSVSSTSYQMFSSKSWVPAPSIEAGAFEFGIAATSSGHVETQAVFTSYPVSLTNVGEYIRATVTFTNVSGLLTQSQHLGFGLYNSGGVAPYEGGLNGTATSGASNAATSGAKNWTGYVTRIFYTGGSHKIATRPAQTGTTNTTQDLITEGSGSQSYSGGANLVSTASTLSLTSGQQYTAVLTITLSAADTYQITSELYPGSDTSGTPLHTQTASAATTNFLTSVFDALAIGWRATSNAAATTIEVNSVKVVTTGSATIVPVVTTAPLGQTKSVGDSVTLSVEADGGKGSALTYQWNKDSVAIPSATSDTYTIPAVSLADAGDYTVTVSNVAGSVTSSAATLHVTTGAVAPAILTQPQSAALAVGASHVLSVGANGTAPLVYLWEKSNDGVTFVTVGTDSHELAIANAQASDAGRYRVTITNAQGTVTSDVIPVVVAPTITTAPSAAIVAAGSDHTIAVVADAGAGAPEPTTYVWKRDDVVVTDGAGISGAQTADLHITAFGAAQSGYYTVTVSNPAGSLTSAPVYVGIPSTQTVTFAPATNATEIAIDQQLRLVFPSAPKLGKTGKLRIHDAGTDAVVSTVDIDEFVPFTLFSATVTNSKVHSVQGKAVHYLPAAVYGNEVWITLPATQRLSYGKTYYVTMDAGFLLDSTNASVPAITTPTAWRFSTKAAGPAPATATTGPVEITVGADGTGDFATIQGAADWIPENNTLPRTIRVLPGVYRDAVYFAQNRNNVTLLGGGATRDDVKVIYHYGNEVYGTGVRGFGGVRIDSNDVTVRNLTLDNQVYIPVPSLAGGGPGAPEFAGPIQTVATTGLRLVFDNVLIKGGQDTLYTIRGIAYFYNCEIWGSVDFIYGEALGVFDRCDIVQIRPTGGPIGAPSTLSAQPYGLVFLNCRFPRALVANGYPYDVGVGTTTFMRTWKQDGATAIINSSIDTHFSTKAWDNWDGRENTARAREYGTTLIGGGAAPTVGQRRDAGAYWVNTIDPDYTNPSMSPTDPLLAAPGGIGNRQDVNVDPADYTLAAIFGHAYFTADLNGWQPTVVPSGTPLITTQPASQTIVAGQSATFTVAGTGTPAPTYQWYKDGIAISGAADASYTIPSVATGDAADYTVTLSNSIGSVTSSTATLTVHVIPTISTQPAGKTAQTGEMVTFSVVGAGTPAPTYQWYKNNALIPDATAATYTITSAVADDSGDYTVVLTNAAGSTTSGIATLVVSSTVAPTSILTHPVNQTVTEGQIVTFAVAAEGAALTYQWKKDGADIDGATAASLVLTGVQAADQGAYSVVVTGLGGTATSDSATLTVTTRTVKTVFNDAFVSGSTVNSATPADPTETSTAYQILSDKGYNPTPAITPTGLRFGIGNTSSGNVEAHALFSPAPVILSGVGDYLELTATLTNVKGMFSAGNNTLFVGLYDSDQVAPVARGLNGKMTGGEFTHALGYAQNWTGYVSRTIYSGGNHQITTRVPQTGNNNQNQSLASVAYRNPGGAVVGTAQPSTLATFAEGAQYTSVLRITRSGAEEYTIESRLHEGAGTGGAVLVTYSGIAAAATFLTDNADHLGFDSLAFGARVSGTGQTIEINSVNIATNASLLPVPKITGQPEGKTIGPGGSASFGVVAEGTGLTYQWFKDDVAIAGATSASHSVTNATSADQGFYKVVVTNDLGGRSTSARAELIVDIAAGTPAPDGFARAVTGGGNRAAITVTTAADLKSYVEQTDPAVITISGTLDLRTLGGNMRVKSNKTIQGIDANATIIGNINIGEGVENVLIRGLNITHPGTTLGSDGRYTDGGDGISIDGAKHVFITHCTVFDCADGLIDTRLGADFITISWCEFYYTAGQLDHRFSNIADGLLIRDETTDEVIAAGAPLRLTMHHNWWSDRCDQRLPSSTNGHIHLYNNYWNTPGNSYAALARDSAQFLSEHNAYENVKSPLSKSDNNALLPDGLIRAIDNLYTNTSGTEPDAGTDTVFTPGYSYQMLAAADVAAVVVQGAGNTAGAASGSLASGSAALDGPAGVVPVNTSFALTPAVTGFTPISYQWRRNNFPIAAATAPTFTLAAMTEAHAGFYTLAMVDAAGDTLVSESHQIVYSSALVPVITTQPASQTVTAGSGALFNVVASGDAPLGYQWQKKLAGNFVNVTGATSASFGFTNTQSVHAGEYRVIVTNDVGVATSATVTLTVNAGASDGGSSSGGGDSGGGGSPSLWFLGSLALLALLRRRLSRA